MQELLSIVSPVFGLIALGYVATRLRLLSERAGDGLADFVFVLAIPFLLFKTLAGAQLPPSLPYTYWATYFVGVAIAWALGMLAARQLFDRDRLESVVAGFASGQSNTVMVGVPLILKAYGPEAAAPLVLLLAIHLPVTMTAATILGAGATATSPREAFGKIATGALTHPILIGIAAGVVARMLDLHPTGAIGTFIDSVAAAAPACALVAMGAALHRYGVKGAFRLALVISTLKLVLHPLVVLLAGHVVFGLDPMWLGVAVLFAACPSGINAYLFAAREKSGEAIASAAVSVSMVLAFVTVTVWLLVLGIGR